MSGSATSDGSVFSDADTYFATAERQDQGQVRKSVELLSRNPVIDTVLNSVGGLLAVLNAFRQIVAVNRKLLDALGVQDAEEVFGLRPGEALRCVHAHELAGGCGTSRYCVTCGAAIAIVGSLCDRETVERECVATVERDGRKEDLFFQVRAHPITVEGQRFILLFLQDDTEHQLRAMLERAFLHDMGNLVTGLLGNAELLNAQGRGEQPPEAAQLLRLSERLAREIQFQRALLRSSSASVEVSAEALQPAEILHEVERIFEGHPVAEGRRLRITSSQDGSVGSIRSDRSIVLRVLANLVTNALEATNRGDSVRLWDEADDSGVTFCVWNKEAIPSDTALRVFQRGFSTKSGRGRGIGTYAVKMLVEQCLKGRVDFTTSPQCGTVFRVYIPNLADTPPPDPLV